MPLNQLKAMKAFECICCIYIGEMTPQSLSSTKPAEFPFFLGSASGHLSGECYKKIKIYI